MNTMWKTVAKWLILIALLAYVGFITAMAREQAANEVCHGVDIVVHGEAANDTVTRRGVADELGRCPHKFIGEKLPRVPVGKIETFLTRFSNFENVECAVTSKGNLRVEVTPIVPELRVFDDSSSYYINKAGKRIQANAEFFSDVPIATGRFSEKFSPVELLPVARFIASDSTLRHLVAMISASDPRNIIIVPRIRGHVVNIGDASRLREKFDALMLAYRKIMPYKGWETYDTISVKYRGQIVATRRNKAPLHSSLKYVEEEDPEEHTLPEIQTSTDNTHSPLTN